MNEYLRKCLEPDRYFVPDLDRLFGRLRLRSTSDGRRRCSAISTKSSRTTGWAIYKALPRQVEKTVKTILKVEEDDDAGKSLEGIYQKLVNHLDGIQFFSGTSGQTLGLGQREALRREGVKCYICEGPHVKRNCPNRTGDSAGARVGVPGRDCGRVEGATAVCATVNSENPI